MRKPLKTGLAVLATASVLAAGPTVAFAGGANDGGSHVSSGDRGDDLRVVGLANRGSRLVTFDTDNPRHLHRRVTVKGLVGGDTRLVGIDFRVQDGRLYGVGNRAAAAGVYRIDLATGRATLAARLTVALSGKTFGVDFNPAADALRVVSDTGQNLRQSFVGFPATATDGTLTYPPATTPATGVNGAAYTNNDLDPDTATSLYVLDTTMDQIDLQSPANAGTLAPTGKLGVDARGDSGLDIYSTVRNGSTVDVTGFAAVNGSLYKITLFSGKASALGGIGAAVSDVALPLKQR